MSIGADRVSYRLPSTTLIFPQCLAEISSLLQQEEDKRLRRFWLFPFYRVQILLLPAPLHTCQGFALTKKSRYDCHWQS